MSIITHKNKVIIRLLKRHSVEHVTSPKGEVFACVPTINNGRITGHLLKPCRTIKQAHINVWNHALAH